MSSDEFQQLADLTLLLSGKIDKANEVLSLLSITNGMVIGMLILLTYWGIRRQ